MAAEPAQTPLPLHRLDVQTYNQIVASGALEGRHVELLDGTLAQMSPKSPGHVAVVTELMRHFAAAPQWWTQVQDPIEVADDSEPEPDIVVATHRPPPGEHLRTALLVVEVAVSSQMINRNIKAAMYAAAGIPTYWLVDVPGRAVEVRTDPGPDGYRRCETQREPTSVPCPLESIADLDIAALFAGLGG